MDNTVSKEDFYLLLHKSAKKYQKLIKTKCLIVYVDIREIKIKFNTRNFAHLVGVSNNNTDPYNYGFSIKTISNNPNHFYKELLKGHLREVILSKLPRRILKKSDMFKKVSSMINILNFFKDPNNVVLIDVDTVATNHTKVKNIGDFRLYNYDKNIVFTIKKELNHYILSSCLSFSGNIPLKSYIENMDIFPVDSFKLLNFLNIREKSRESIKSDFNKKTKNIKNYNFIYDAYSDLTLEEIERLNQKNTLK